MNTSSRIILASEGYAGYFTPYQFRCSRSYCLDSSLNRTKAKGKVLVCRHAGSSSESKLERIIIVKETSGVPMILIDEVDKGVAIPFNIPATTVSFPTTRVLSSKTFLGAQPAPRVVAFFSRVPNL